MPILLLKSDTTDEAELVTRIGGRPLAPSGFAWPACGECGSPMQFLAQILLRDADPSFADRLLLLFMCQAPPFLCASGAPGSSASFAVCVGVGRLAPCTPPRDAPYALRGIEGLMLRPFETPYEDARASVQPGEFVYGHLGDPAESVSKFVPSCPTCQAPMRFIVQLEEGWDAERAMNFNGVTAFAYACATCPDRAAIFVDDFF
ncbi:MAG: DUF1963 domain-containing protein [Minicystis sp.]